MRRRLAVIYATLLTVVLVGLIVPLAVTIAAREGNELFLERQRDTARFASLAVPVLRTGDSATLQAELDRYGQARDTAVAIVGPDGEPVLASLSPPDLSSEPLRSNLGGALAGQGSFPPRTALPWRTAPLVVAEPVSDGGEVVGAAVTISPTDAMRAAVWRSWGLLAGAGVLVLVAGIAAAGPLTTWMLRPVHQLDQAAHGLAAGRLGHRALAVPGPPELRRLTDSFNAMADRIHGMVERQRSFVSYASHQLRTPLATLRLAVENLEPWVEPAGQEDYRMVAAEIERMGDLCDALLAYARADVTAADFADLDAVEVTEARLGVWSRAFRQAGIELRGVGERSGPVRAAPQALDQALDALLSNAVKYVGRGNHVVVLVDTIGNDWVDIHVIDNGPGIPEHDLARAAQPFWRAADQQPVDGSGLGITIADALVTASGGRLDLMPAQPHGLHARVRLPAQR